MANPFLKLLSGSSLTVAAPTLRLPVHLPTSLPTGGNNTGGSGYPPTPVHENASALSARTKEIEEFGNDDSNPDEYT